MQVGAFGDDHGGACQSRDLAGLDLGGHAAAAEMARGAAGHRLDLGGDGGDHGRGGVAPGSLRWRGGVEPVDIRQQHQAVRLDHGGDAGRQPVVVAVADLGGGDGIVLVDDRHGAQRQQRRDGGAGVEIVAPLLGDVGGDKDLPGDDAVVPRPRPRPGSARSARRSPRPALLQRQVICASSFSIRGRARWRRRRRSTTATPAPFSAAMSSPNAASHSARTLPLAVDDGAEPILMVGRR